MNPTPHTRTGIRVFVCILTQKMVAGVGIEPKYPAYEAERGTNHITRYLPRS